MRRKFIHILKEDRDWPGNAQTRDGVTLMPFTRFLFCGKKQELLREIPEPVLNAAEQKRHDAVIKKEEENPSTPCPKCQKALAIYKQKKGLT